MQSVFMDICCVPACWARGAQQTQTLALELVNEQMVIQLKVMVNAVKEKDCSEGMEDSFR